MTPDMTGSIGMVRSSSVRARLTSALLRAPVWLSVAAFVLAVGVMVAFHPVGFMQIDTLVYRRGAQALLAGTDRLYEQPYGALPFTYPPIAALLFLPLALPWENVASFALLVAGVAALWRLTWVVLDVLRPEQAGRGHARLAALLLPVAVLTEPVFKTFSYGQINLILAWLVAEDLLRLRRGRFGGVLIAIATLIKLTPAAFFLVVLLRRDVGSLLRGSATVLAGVVTGFLLMPGSSRIFWSSLTGASERVGDPAYFLNQSIKGVLARAGVGAGSAWLLACLLVLAVTVWTVHVALAAGRDVPAVLATAFCALMISPVSWSHHWVWTWPLLLWTFAGHHRRPGPWTVTAAGVWVVVLFGYPLWWAVPHDVPWADVPWWQMLLADSYALLGVGTVVMLGLRAARLRRSSAPTRAPVTA